MIMSAGAGCIWSREIAVLYLLLPWSTVSSLCTYSSVLVEGGESIVLEGPSFHLTLELARLRSECEGECECDVASVSVRSKRMTGERVPHPHYLDPAHQPPSGPPKRRARCTHAYYSIQGRLAD